MSYGHVYVADAMFDNIQVFDQQGRLLLHFGRSGQQPGEFWLPMGIFIDESNRITCNVSSALVWGAFAR